MAGRGRSAGSVRVDVVASNAKFDKAIKASQTRLQRFQRFALSGARKLQAQWKNAALAMAGVGVAVLAAIKNMTDYSSSVVETARVVGLTTKELENLRKLFEGDGIGVKKADRALKDFNVRVGFAQRGVGQYTRAFEELGVELKNADGSFKSNSKLLTEVAGKLKDNDDKARAASLAYELFGTSGRDLLPILQAHGKALEENARHAGRYNTLTDEQQEKNKELGQSLMELKTNALDLVYRVLSEYSDELIVIVNKFNEWISSIKASYGTFAAFIGQLEKMVNRTAILMGFSSGAVAGATAGSIAGSLLGPAGTFAGIMLGGSIGGLLGGFGSGFALDYITPYFDTAEETLAKEMKALQEEQDRLLLEDHLTQEQADRYNWIVKRIEAIKAEQAAIVKAREEAKRLAEEDKKRRKDEGDDAEKKIKNEKTYWDIVKENTRKYKGLSEIDIAGMHGVQIPGLWSPEETPAEAKAAIGDTMAGRDWRARFDYENRKRTMGGDHLLYGSKYAHLPRVGVGYDQGYNPNAGWGQMVGRGDSAGGGFALDPQMLFGDRSMPYFGDVADPTRGRGLLDDIIPPTRGRGLLDNVVAPTEMDPAKVPAGLVPTYFRPGEVERAKKLLQERIASMSENVSDAMIKNMLRIVDEWEKNVMTPGPDSIAGDEGRMFAENLRKQQMQSGRLGGRIYGPQGTNALRFAQSDAQAMGFFRKAGEGKVNEEFEAFKAEMQDIKSLAGELESSFSSFTHSLISDFKNAGEAARSLARDILKIATQRMIVNPVTNLLFGAADGDGGSGIFGSMASAFVGAFADGGRAGRGMALVGERGPELVDFSQPGMVYSTEQLGAAMRGKSGYGAPTINISVQSTDGPGVRAAIAEATPMIVSAANSQMMESTNRVGATRTIMQGRR